MHSGGNEISIPVFTLNKYEHFLQICSSHRLMANMPILILSVKSTKFYWQITRFFFSFSLGKTEEKCSCYRGCHEHGYNSDMSTVLWPNPGTSHLVMDEYFLKNEIFREKVSDSFSRFLFL